MAPFPFPRLSLDTARLGALKVALIQLRDVDDKGGPMRNLRGEQPVADVALSERVSNRGRRPGARTQGARSACGSAMPYSAI